MSRFITRKSVNGKHYELTEILSFTHTTSVYLCHEVGNPQFTYALKKPTTQDGDERVKQEANFLIQTAHPNFVQYIDHSESKKSPYLVMEHVPGTLDRLISDGCLTRKIFNDFVAQMPVILKVLNYLDITHCDLTPFNISYDGNMIKVFDFDQARVCKSPMIYQPTVSVIAQMTPEHAFERKITPTTDQYCLGKLLEWLLLGRYVREQNGEELIEMHYPNMPASFLELYNSMTDYDPNSRLNLDDLDVLSIAAVTDLHHKKPLGKIQKIILG